MIEPLRRWPAAMPCPPPATGASSTRPRAGHHVRAQPNPVMDGLRALGLWGVRATRNSSSAYLAMQPRTPPRAAAGPAGYRRPGREVRRRALLHRELRAWRTDVVELVRSLGGWCTLTDSAPLIRTPTCSTSIIASRARFPALDERDRLPEHASVRHPVDHVDRAARTVATQCISVSHPSRLYVTDDYVVTHNTSFALNVAEHVAPRAQAAGAGVLDGDGRHAARHAPAGLGRQGRRAEAAHRPARSRRTGTASAWRSAS